MDSSGSISRTSYLKEKAFIKAVAQSFGISSSQSRAALVLFSNSASVKIRFRDHTSTNSFKQAVDRLPHERGFTRIDKALEVATKQVFPYARKGVHQIAFVITDGEQTQASDTKDLKEVSEPLRKAGVQVLALGIGSGVNPDELRLIVEKEEDVLIAKSFQDLLDRIGGLIKSTCDLAGKIPFCLNVVVLCCVVPFALSEKSYFNIISTHSPCSRGFRKTTDLGQQTLNSKHHYKRHKDQRK